MLLLLDQMLIIARMYLYIYTAGLSQSDVLQTRSLAVAKIADRTVWQHAIFNGLLFWKNRCL